jgi:hypothetical protein
MRTFYLLVAFSLLPSHGYRQNQERFGRKNLDDRTSEPLDTIAPSQTAQQWEIKTKYDQFRDVTSVMLDGMELSEASTSFGLTHPLSLTAFYLCPGNTAACSPADVVLDFQADTKDWLYQTVQRTIIFLVDGKRITAPDADWDGSVIGAESLLEQMDTIIPTAKFLSIIQGQRVKGQIAFTTFDFTADNLKALRDLMSKSRPVRRKVTPASPKPTIPPR